MGTVDQIASGSGTPRAYSSQGNTSRPSSSGLGLVTGGGGGLPLVNGGDFDFALAPIEVLESMQPYKRSSIDELHLRALDSRLFQSSDRRRST
jgi:hypothetical protein